MDLPNSIVQSKEIQNNVKKRKRKTSKNEKPNKKIEDMYIHANMEHHTPIKFKTNLDSIEEPTFVSLAYCIQQCSTKNTLTLELTDLHRFINKSKVKKSIVNTDFYICIKHKLQETPILDCVYCTKFLQFTYTYLLVTKYHIFPFPPPKWYTPIVLNFLNNFCDSANASLTSKTSHDRKIKELDNYGKFINMNYSEGNLNSLSAGKTSYIRNSILGYHTLGVRATLTIDSTLSPHYAILPQSIFDRLNMACPLVILNRAPSIKNTCIYAVEVLRNPDPYDLTIKINSYITEGLHADQDGDELTIFYIQHPGTNIPCHKTEMAISELKCFSWKYGPRYDMSFKPRYEFTQYLKYILWRYNNYFCKHNKLWANLTGNNVKKCRMMMHLGCSIFPKEVDDFIDLLSAFVKNLSFQLPTIVHLLKGTGSIHDVILSGAKGEQLHMEQYLSNLYNLDVDKVKKLIANFNNYISSSSEMSINGAFQFLILGAINPLYLLNDRLFYNDKVLAKDIGKNTTMASYLYNSKACDVVFNYIAKNNNFITEEDIDAYIREYKYGKDG